MKVDEAKEGTKPLKDIFVTYARDKENPENDDYIHRFVNCDGSIVSSKNAHFSGWQSLITLKLAPFLTYLIVSASS